MASLRGDAMTTGCSVAACDAPHHAHGMCSVHVQRWKSWGDPLAVSPRLATMTAIEKFWADLAAGCFADEGPCVEWPGSRNDAGYGTTKRLGENIASRAVWAFLHGPIPDDMQVCHRCDNPPCCRPPHLFLGDALANCNDKIAKGRQVVLTGERNPRTTIPDSVVAEMKRLHADGVSFKQLARNYGVHPVTVSRICRGLRRTAGA